MMCQSAIGYIKCGKLGFVRFSSWDLVTMTTLTNTLIEGWYKCNFNIFFSKNKKCREQKMQETNKCKALIIWRKQWTFGNASSYMIDKCKLWISAYIRWRMILDLPIKFFPNSGVELKNNNLIFKNKSDNIQNRNIPIELTLYLV